MAVTHSILPLERHQYRDARKVLARAFFDYNLMIYAAPASGRRARGVDALYAAFLHDCSHHGEVFVTSDVTGAACWLPPGTGAPNLIRQLRAGLLGLPFRFGLTGFRQLLAYDAVARDLHHRFAPTPHWYLAAIGVEPTRQGQGLGGALMQPVLTRADASNLPCYLETHEEKNVRLYQKHGFEVCEKAQVPGHPIPVWGMRRNPAGAKNALADAHR